MGRDVVRRARADLSHLNGQRHALGLEPYPSISCIWVVHPFKRDTKMHQSLERRGNVLLDDLLARPDCPVDPAWFPPTREIFIPNECAWVLLLLALEELLIGVDLGSSLEGMERLRAGSA